MTTLKNIDPVALIAEAFRNAEERGDFHLATSLISDAAWKEITEIAHTHWPDHTAVSDEEKRAFVRKHDSLALGHFIELVFELERLYSVINWLRPKANNP